MVSSQGSSLKSNGQAQVSPVWGKRQPCTKPGIVSIRHAFADFGLWLCLFLLQNSITYKHTHVLLLKVKVKIAQSCPTLCDPMDHTVHGILQARILEWVAFPFSKVIFPIQGLNPGLPHCRRILYQLSHKGNPRILEWVTYSFSSRSSQPRNQTGVSCIAGRFFTNWAMREACFALSDRLFHSVIMLLYLWLNSESLRGKKHILCFFCISHSTEQTVLNIARVCLTNICWLISLWVMECKLRGCVMTLQRLCVFVCGDGIRGSINNKFQV